MQVVGGAELRSRGETMHLHSTDHEGEWLVRMEPDGLRVSREHAKGDAAVRGPAADLLLVVVGRAPATTVEVLGDGAVLDRWAQGAKF
jgi:predicted lipid carrier protein YhbT